nr:CDP-alcohol phosphatidyltransferase family protein [uncultured Cohaesibacter sp.]
MTIPNIITIARMLMVPLLVWLLVEGRYDLAFWTFMVAGVSDAIDGILARKFDMQSDLGSYLDPLADKALMVSIYVTLGFMLEIPTHVVIAVVSRDILIVAAVVLSWMLDRPVPMKPLMISKANTTVQILFAGLVLAELGSLLSLNGEQQILGNIVVIFTVTSAIAYLVDWAGHMARDE